MLVLAQLPWVIELTHFLASPDLLSSGDFFVLFFLPSICVSIFNVDTSISTANTIFTQCFHCIN